MKLFCLPYAGGSSAIFSSWKKYSNSNIEICPIELPGRGRRNHEPFCNNIDDIVNDIYKQIEDYIMQDTYAFFGHSMGSLIAYELCHKINIMKTKKPSHVFFSGHKAPNIKRKEQQIYDLPDIEFKKKVLEIGGTPEELFEHKDLYEYFVPVIRADFKVVELYEYKEKGEKLSINISVINGRDDDIKINEILEWRKHTTCECKIFTLEGGHFFINDSVENIVKIINHTLEEYI